jgi:hypothetical protein
MESIEMKPIIKKITKKEALQIALEALTDFDYDKRIKAIESIEQALETKEWVWLTDKEVDECLRGLPTQTIDVYARRIETKIKEKNT